MMSVRMKLGCIAALALVIAAPNRDTGAQSTGLSVFPGAQGFGSRTRAAYSGSATPTIYRVTTLNDSGAGSLREALTATGPRVVIFEISGTIMLGSRITISSGSLTVAGQTAPSPGITVGGHEIAIKASDVLIQHLRVRPGDVSGEIVSSIWPQTGSRIFLDHVSLSWGTGTTTNAYHLNLCGCDPIVTDATWSNSIISEGLLGGSFTPVPRGMSIGQRTRNISLIRNLFAHNHERNPVIKQDTTSAVVNNVNYNPGDDNMGAITPIRDVSEAQAPLYASVVGNVGIPGPSTASPSDWRMIHIYSTVDPSSRIYVSDNFQDLYYSASNPWALVRNNVGASVQASAPPVWDTSIVVLPHDQVKAHVLANAGARPADRDAVDRRIVNDVMTGTGGLINSQNQVGAWPTLAVNRRALTLPANPHAITSSGYTNLEVWLHGHAAEVEGRSAVTGPQGPAPPTHLRIVS